MLEVTVIHMCVWLFRWFPMISHGLLFYFSLIVNPSWQSRTENIVALISLFIMTFDEVFNYLLLLYDLISSLWNLGWLIVDTFFKALQFLEGDLVLTFAFLEHLSLSLQLYFKLLPTKCLFDVKWACVKLLSQCTPQANYLLTHQSCVLIMWLSLTISNVMSWLNALALNYQLHCAISENCLSGEWWCLT